MLAHDAYERLRKAIYTGQLAAGERIVERELAQRFRISRIPLRESLVRLQAEGLVRSVPFSSSYVEDLEPADVMEIYSLRLLFEPLAARLAAMHATQRFVKRLEAYCHRMTALSRKSTPVALDQVDYAFHHSIVEASGHRRLLRAYEGAHIRVVSLRADHALLKSQSPERVSDEHLKIVLPLRQRDPDGAEQAAREHVEQSIRVLEESLGSSVKQIGKRRSSDNVTRSKR